MGQKILFWDLEGTILKTAFDTEQLVAINDSAKDTLERLTNAGYTNYVLQPLNEHYSERAATRAGLEKYFKNYFNASDGNGCRERSISAAKQKLRMGDKRLKEDAVFIGNTLKNGLVHGIDGLVHIINPYSMNTEFSFYETILELLQNEHTHFSKSFEILSKKTQVVRFPYGSVFFCKNQTHSGETGCVVNYQRSNPAHKNTLFQAYTYKYQSV